MIFSGMEKDSSQYCYETYPAVPKTNSLKRNKTKQRSKEKHSSNTCNCLGSKRSKGRQFLSGLATNLGICILLFGYTLIGSVIFLAIEGGGNNNLQHQILATTSLATNMKEQKRNFNSSAELRAKNDEARAKTVENIWDITVSLNILYR